MNRMLIAGAAACVLLAGAAVGSAVVVGKQTQGRIETSLAGWQATWPMLKVVEQRYDAGVFAATHDVTFQLGCTAADATGAAPGKPLQFTLRQRIQHGPLPGFAGVGSAVIDTELVLPEGLRQTVAELTAQQPPLTAHTVVGLGGDFRTQIAVPQFQFTGPQGQQFAWQGLQADLRSKGAAVEYDMVLPGATVAASDDKMSTQVTLGAMKARGEFSGAGGLWLMVGKGEGELAAMEVSVESRGAQATPPVKLALSQLKFSADTSLDKDLIATTSRITGQGTVSGVKLDKFDMQVSLKRLHAPTYERMVQRLLASAASCDTKQAAMAPELLLAQMQQDMAALLPFDPEYALDRLAVEIDGQRGELAYSVGVQGVTEADLKLPLPALLMGKAKVAGRASLPVVWVEKTLAGFGAAQSNPAAQAQTTQAMLSKMTTEGFVVREGTQLSTQFSFDKGQMVINGKPVGPVAALGRPPAAGQ